MSQRILLVFFVLSAPLAQAGENITFGRWAQNQPAPDGTLPPVTVRPGANDMQPTPGMMEGGMTAPSYDGMNFGDNNGYQGVEGYRGRGAQYYPFGTITWNSNELTRDSDRVGPYNQPLWTTQRPFSATRAYVLPAGQMQVEQWVRPTIPRGNDPVKFRMLEEYAIGLPGRFQLDVYERWNIEPDAANQQRANHEGVQIELRYAFADWGVIPFNPTIYLEWVERGGRQEGKPDKYEIKLLFAEQLSDRCFYASNLILEQEAGGERENELGWSNALSFTVIERRLLAGIECLWSGANNQFDPARSSEFTIGPSTQLRVGNRWYLNSVALFGTSNDAPACQMYFILGYQFGGRAGPAGRYISGPASTMGN